MYGPSANTIPFRVVSNINMAILTVLNCFVLSIEIIIFQSYHFFSAWLIMGFLEYSDEDLSNGLCYMGIGVPVTKLEEARTF